MKIIRVPATATIFKSAKSNALTAGLLCCVLICSVTLRAQVPGAADSFRVQASRMANAFISGDYNTYLHYLTPVIIEAKGGADNILRTTTYVIKQWGKQGIRFQSVCLDSPTAILRQGRELQCAIRKHTVMKLQHGHSLINSSLIGLSNDNGVHWKFMDTNGLSNEDIKALLPHLSSAIVIPPQPPPYSLP